MKDDDSNWVRSLGYFGIIIGDIVGCTGAGVGFGYLAWNKWGAPWWVLLISSMVGLILAFYRLYRMIQRDSDAEK
jgi:F0F1-type ATP synthase assembly protein I